MCLASGRFAMTSEAHLARVADLARARHDLPDEVTRRVDVMRAEKAPVVGFSNQDLLLVKSLESSELARAELALRDLDPREAQAEYEMRLRRMDVNRGDLFFIRALEAQQARRFRGLRNADAPDMREAVVTLGRTMAAARAARVPEALQAHRTQAENDLTSTARRLALYRGLPTWSDSDSERATEEARRLVAAVG